MKLSNKNKVLNITLFALACLVIVAFYFHMLPGIKTDVSVYQYTNNAVTFILPSGESETFANPMKRTVFNRLHIIFANDEISNIEVTLKDTDSSEVLFQGDFTSSDVSQDIYDRYYVEVVGDKVFPASDYEITITNNGNSDVSLTVAGENNESIGVVAIKDTNDGKKIATTIMVLALLYVSAVFIVSYKSELTILKFFLVSAVSLSIIYLILFPVWSTTDFQSHYAAANRFANLILGRSDYQWYSSGVYYDYLNRIDGGAPYPSMRGYTYFLENMGFIGGDNGTIVEGFRDDKMMCYSIFNYLPSALGLILASTFNFAPMTGLILTRVFVVIFYIAGCYHAIKVTPVGKSVFAAVALLPEVVFLCGSFSYDSAVVVTTLNFLACAFAAAKPQSRDSMKFAKEAMLWAFLIGAVKGGGYLILLPVAFMMCFMSDKKNLSRKSYLTPVTIAASGLVSVLIFNVIMNTGTSMFQFGGYSDKMSASDAFTQPVLFMQMLLTSYVKYSGKYITGLLGNELAWSEVVLPGFLVILMFIPLLIVAILEKDDYKINGKSKILFGIAIALELIFMPMMLLSYTDVGSATIEGVQGRYFLPVLPLIMLLVTNHKYDEKFKLDSDRVKTIRTISFWMHTVLAVIAVMCMLQLFVSRSVS